MEKIANFKKSTFFAACSNTYKEEGFNVIPSPFVNLAPKDPDLVFGLALGLHVFKWELSLGVIIWKKNNLL